MVRGNGAWMVRGNVACMVRGNGACMSRGNGTVRTMAIVLVSDGTESWTGACVLYASMCGCGCG